MGGLFDAIADFVGDVLGAVWDAICDIMDAVWQFLSHNIIEPIMNFLGFEDEIIYITDVIAVKVFQESVLPDTKIRAALKKQSDDLSALEFLGEFETKGNLQFNKYFRRGKYSYTDHLPECQINAVSIPTDEFSKILEDKLGTPVKINDVLAGVPFDEYWCKYRLQEQYDYNVSTNAVFIDDVYYIYDNVVYDGNTNKFRVTLNNLSSVVEKIYETSSVFVADTVDVEETDPENPNNTITVTKEIKRTLIYQRSVFQRIDNDMFLYETDDTLISSTDEIVDLGTTITTTRFYLASEHIVNYESKPITIMIDNHNNDRCYTVKYNTGNNRMFLWIYNPNTNEYPTLGAPVSKIVGFETYPIVMLRNGFFDVNEYDTDTKTVDGEKVSRPPSITKERYNDTVDMVSSLGLKLSDLIDSYSDNPDIDKLQDAFIGLSISPANTSEIVSKVLYEIFDFIYDELPPVDITDSYAASFKENPFNAAITWIPKGVSFYEGTIGKVGTYKHTISKAEYRADKIEHNYTQCSGTRTKKVTLSYEHRVYRNNELIISYIDDETYTEIYEETHCWHSTTRSSVVESHVETGRDLIIEYQIEPNVVKKISVFKLAGFHIIRRGSFNGGVTLNIDNENFVIPLPVPVVERLSVIEKTALLSEAVYMIFYAYDEVHLRWYETEAFMNLIKIVMYIIMIVIIIISFGTATGIAASGMAALEAFIMALGKLILISIISFAALKLIASTNWSPQLKAVMSFGVMIAAAWAGGAFDEFTALTALELVSITAEAVNIYIGEVQLNLQNNTNSVYSAYEKRSSELEDITKGLYSGVDTAFIASLSLDNTTQAPSQYRMYTPSQFIYMCKEAVFNRDVLFMNSAEQFKNNMNNPHIIYA
jgi:hypothetical protein